MKLTLLIICLSTVALVSSCNSSQNGASGNSSLNRVLRDSTNTSTNIFKSNFNCDTLKDVFSNSPFNYVFKDEVALQGTNDSHIEGKEDESQYEKYIDSPDKIVIYFDRNSRRVKSATFYLNHFKTANIKLKHLKRLFEFLNYFDPQASKFIVKNFKTLFYDENAYDNLKQYRNDQIGLEMGVDHSLFDARKVMEKTDDKVFPDEEYVDVTLTFS